MENHISSENFLLTFLISKKWRIFRHVTMVVVIMIDFYPELNLNNLKSLNVSNAELLVRGIKIGSAIMFAVSMVIIYLNLLFFIPRYLLRNKFVTYLVMCCMLALLFFFCEYAVTNHFLRPVSKYIDLVDFSVKGFIDSTFIPIVFLCATAGYKIFKKWIIDAQLLAELKQSRIQDELQSLKNQINPHFLFNTLNNLNTLISSDSAKASAIVLGLSDVLRYQLYEANADKVLLKKDIEILRQYLELEKIRRDNFQFSLNMNSNVSGILIPPFIFINFVENAIKHSLDSKGFSYITIDFSIKEGFLYFTCKNSKPLTAALKKTGGLGLQNIKRRLELMYDGKYALDINEADRDYTIELKLPFQ
jgi:sensor histidine kinase YesM